jgi:hypothetical protein
MSARDYVTLAGRCVKAIAALTDAIDRHTAALNRASDIREEELT